MTGWLAALVYIASTVCLLPRNPAPSLPALLGPVVALLCETSRLRPLHGLTRSHTSRRWRPTSENTPYYAFATSEFRESVDCFDPFLRHMKLSTFKDISLSVFRCLKAAQLTTPRSLDPPPCRADRLTDPLLTIQYVMSMGFGGIGRDLSKIVP